MQFFFILIYIFFSNYQSLSSCYVPEYDGLGPRNVYYLTGMGDRLFTHKDPAANQDAWALPYECLRDIYLSKGYTFLTSLPSNIDDTFKKNVKLIFWHNMCTEEMCIKLGESVMEKVVVLILEPPHVMLSNYNLRVHKYFKKVLTYDTSLVDNIKYFKYFFVQST
jgi:hypothetical protein